MDSKEAVQHNEPTTEQNLNKETDNQLSWKEELAEEVKQIVEQSAKHAVKAGIEEADQGRDLNEKDVKDTGKRTEGENTLEVPPSDSVQNIEDVDDEKKKEDVSKSSEILESSKQSDYIETAENSDSGKKKPGNDDASNKDNQKVEEADMAEKSIDEQQQQQQPTETSNKKDKEDGRKMQAGEERRGEEVKTGQYNKKSKAKAKKGHSRKKVSEREALDEWDSDDYDDIDSYDEDFDDENMDDGEIEDFYEDPDSTSKSWKMTEKPLDEAEELSDEEDDNKIKEDLQEEINQLKGFIYYFFKLYICSNRLRSVTCNLFSCCLSLHFCYVVVVFGSMTKT